MNNQDRENLYALLREHGDNVGVARTTVLALQALIEALADLKITSRHPWERYQELANTVRESEPKIIPLIHLLERFEEQVQDFVQNEGEAFRDKAITLLQALIDLFEEKAHRLTGHGTQFVQDGDVIIVHSPSSVVDSILLAARQKDARKFKVTILQQNMSRTRQLIRLLKENNIEHLVIPEYNLSHHLNATDKLFLGAVTITEDHQVIAPVGTANTVSQCHLKGAEVYLFANSLHFSHEKGMDQRIFHRQELFEHGGEKYQVTRHSHDIFDLKLIDHVINEDGKLNPFADSPDIS